MILHIRMWSGSFPNVQQKLLRGKKLSTGFAFLQDVSSDDLIPNEDRPHAIRFLQSDGPGWTDVGARAAADALPRRWNDEVFPTHFLHLERPRTDDLLADAYTQAAPDASIGRRSQIHSMFRGQPTNTICLRRHLKEVFEGFCPGPLDGLPVSLDIQAVFDFQNTREQQGRSSDRAHHFHRAQLARSGRLEGWMIAQRGNPDVECPESP